MAAIFLIWPEFQKISPQLEALKSKEALVASIREKNNNIANLTRSLDDSQNAPQKDFVLNYIPLEKREERIFNTISAIANAEGVKVALSNVSLQSAKAEAQPVAVDATALPPQFPLAAPAAGDAMPAPVSVLPAVQTLKADISTVGSYESQKNFIARLYALDMLKKITSFDLSKAGADGGGSKDLLNGSISAEFGFIPEAKIGGDYNDPIFSQRSFDFGAVEKLTTLLSQKTAEVAVGEAGRTNPFLP